MLFSEPKIPQYKSPRESYPLLVIVSVLFSEPKIPQYKSPRESYPLLVIVSVLFSEPKIPQSDRAFPVLKFLMRFSALQRAENSSIDTGNLLPVPAIPFQCSSASRKFLNPTRLSFGNLIRASFSALQRAENSSIFWAGSGAVWASGFQCSSASRKFLN